MKSAIVSPDRQFMHRLYRVGKGVPVMRKDVRLGLAIGSVRIMKDLITATS